MRNLIIAITPAQKLELNAIGRLIVSANLQTIYLGTGEGEFIPVRIESAAIEPKAIQHDGSAARGLILVAYKEKSCQTKKPAHSPKKKPKECASKKGSARRN